MRSAIQGGGVRPGAEGIESRTSEDAECLLRPCLRAAEFLLEARFPAFGIDPANGIHPATDE